MADDEVTPGQVPAEDGAKKPYYDYNQQQADKHRQQALTDAQVAEDVLRNPRYDAFFAPYQPKVREDFVRDYVTRRQFWTQFGDFYERHLTGQLTQFEREAYTRLWDIQQKKLFDLQCQWRAELVAVPGVQTSADFGTLSAGIENCLAVPPITPAELALYLDWVRQANYEEELLHNWGDLSNWQDYRDVKNQLDPDEAEEDDWSFEEVSEWYEFHNQRTGNGRLLRLPDLRGQKEERYLDAWRAGSQAEREQAQEAAAATPAPPPDLRPAYVHGEEGRALQFDFARQFESPALNRQREAYEAANPPETWEDEELRRVVDFLEDLDEAVPIEAGPDWRLAVRKASYDYRQQKLLLHLPQAYEAYCQRRAWNIAQPPHQERERHSTAEWYNKAVLDGRELLGEPRDFDF